MKRSEVNEILDQSWSFIKSHGVHLPPFAHWSPEKWRTMGPEVREIVENNLGWDITDFGSGDYEPLRFGAIVGSGVGGLHTLEIGHDALVNKGPTSMSPFMIPRMIPNMASGVIAIRHNRN